MCACVRACVRACMYLAEKDKKKAYSTWYSQAVSHPSTNQARLCLASEIGRDRACSEWYGRKQRQRTTEGLIYSQWQTRLTQSVCQNGKKSLALLTQLLWLLFVRKARAYQASWTSLYAPNFNTVTTTAICEESSCLKSKLIFSVSFQFYIAVE